jgi:hypothetical protein
MCSDPSLETELHSILLMEFIHSITTTQFMKWTLLFLFCFLGSLALFSCTPWRSPSEFYHL